VSCYKNFEKGSVLTGYVEIDSKFSSIVEIVFVC